MLKYVPKSIKYYTGTVTALWAGRAAVGVEVELLIVGLVCVLLVPLVIFYVNIEERYKDEKDLRPHRSGDDQGGMLLNLAEALNRVSFADPNDEKIADLANKLVRRRLDKRCISYHAYKSIRQKNPLVFAAVVSEQNELIGFFDIFPLTDAAAMDLVDGRKWDADIAIDDIAPLSDLRSVRYIYIATILCDEKQKAFSASIGREIVSLKIYEYIMQKFSPLEDRILVAYGHTEEGQRLLERAHFTVRRTAKDTVQRKPLYILEPGKAVSVRQRYLRICNALSALEDRRPTNPESGRPSS